jgi:hypothetical protein
MAGNEDLMDLFDIVDEVEEEVAWDVGKSNFVAIVGLSSTEVAIEFTGLAIVDYSWDHKKFFVTKDWVVGSNLFQIVAIVEGPTTRFDLIYRARYSELKFFDC